MARILVVEPEPGTENRWRFGRVERPDDPLGRDCGRIEARADGFHLLQGGADAITALLLLRRHEGPARRLVHEPDARASGEPASPDRSVEAHPSRAARSTRGRAKGGGATLAERAARDRAR